MPLLFVLCNVEITERLVEKPEITNMTLCVQGAYFCNNKESKQKIVQQTLVGFQENNHGLVWACYCSNSIQVVYSETMTLKLLSKCYNGLAISSCFFFICSLSIISFNCSTPLRLLPMCYCFINALRKYTYRISNRMMSKRSFLQRFNVFKMMIAKLGNLLTIVKCV